MKTSELYERITNQIITELEAGNLPPWLMPFRESKRGKIMPVNHATGHHYQGLNVLVLWGERQSKGYKVPEWLTYKQCQALGGQVRKGEKSSPIIFASKHSIEDGDVERLIPFMRLFGVFNVEQCDGLSVNEREPELPEHERDEQAEAFFAATKAETLWGQSMAAYVPSRDIIMMPERGAFHGPENLYAVWAHESVHWSGHKSRLARDMSGRFKQDSYAFEELVAEIGAAMLCGVLGVKGELRHTSYIAGWLKILKGDSKAILTAASLASKACEYLRAFSETKQEEAA